MNSLICFNTERFCLIVLSLSGMISASHGSTKTSFFRKPIKVIYTQWQRQPDSSKATVVGAFVSGGLALWLHKAKKHVNVTRALAAATFIGIGWVGSNLYLQAQSRGTSGSTERRNVTLTSPRGIVSQDMLPLVPVGGQHVDMFNTFTSQLNCTIPGNCYPTSADRQALDVSPVDKAILTEYIRHAIQANDAGGVIKEHFSIIAKRNDFDTKMMFLQTTFFRTNVTYGRDLAASLLPLELTSTFHGYVLNYIATLCPGPLPRAYTPISKYTKYMHYCGTHVELQSIFPLAVFQSIMNGMTGHTIINTQSSTVIRIDESDENGE